MVFPRVLAFLIPLLLAAGFFADTARAGANIREIATFTVQRGAEPEETLEVELFQDTSPHAVANFKYLADTRFYDNTAFHRLLPGFMVQGGCPITRNDTEKTREPYYGQGGPEYTIPDEPTSNLDRKHVRGVLSMAKTDAPNSGGSQFFIMFGDAPWLDNKHAPMGNLISGNVALDALEKEEVSPNSSGTEISIPQRLLTLRSIRVRSEYIGASPSGALSFQPGTFSGPLRGADRNFELKGTYRVTLSKTGVFSAQLLYFGRTNSFSGKLTQPDPSRPQAAFAALQNATPGKIPLRVRIQARNTPSGKTALSVLVCGLTSEGADQEDATLAVGSGELVPSSDFAERHTVFFEAPRVVSGSNAVLAVGNMAGCGFLTMKTQPLTRLTTGTGMLPDGRTFSFSRPIVSEGDRNVLPVYLHEVPTGFAKNFTPAAIPLADWPSKHLPDPSLQTPDFSSLTFRLNGCLQLPSISGTYVTSPPNYLKWYREPKTSGTVRSAVIGTVYPAVRQWTPPKTGAVFAPFKASKKGILGGLYTAEKFWQGQFNISASNTVCVFDYFIAAPFNQIAEYTDIGAKLISLRINPLDGSFKGSLVYADKLRKNFYGILLSSKDAGDLNGGWGTLMLADQSYRMVVLPQ